MATTAMPPDETGAEALAVRVISASDLAREQTVGRAAAAMLGRH